MRPLSPHDPPAAGPYQLLAQLGEDAHTHAYLGSTPGRSPVRVRILRAEHATDPTTRADFLQRVESASGLGGPHVAAVLDADLDSPVPWAVTETPFCADLAGLVRAHGPLPAAAMHTLALATAQGLATLHSAERSHGTLTPEGVLLTSDRALLADPGLVPPADRDGSARGVFDPLEGGGAPAGDVFAWAAVLCFAASGVEGPDGLDQVPLQLRAVVDDCLRENADLRPSSVDLVSMLGGAASASPWPPELASVIEAEAARMRGMLPAEPETPGPRDRRRLIALTAGAVALALFTAIGSSWWLNRATPAGGSADGSGSDATCSEGSAFPEPVEPVTDLDAMQLEFSPDGDVLAVGSFNHGLTLWDWREGEELARPAEELNGLGPMSFAPVGCVIAATSLQEVEGQERPYRLTTTFDLASGEATNHPGPQPEPLPDGSQKNWSVTDLAFNPDGRRMALSNRVGVGTGTPVEVVDLESGEAVAALGEDLVPQVAFLDEIRLAAHTRNSIEIWDTESGETLQTIRNVTELHFAVVPGEDQILFVRNDEIILYDLAGGAATATFPTGDYADTPDAWVNHLGMDAERGLVHFSWSLAAEEGPDNLGTDRENETHGYLWDIETGENLLEDDDGLMPRPVAFHPEVIAAVNQDGNVDIIDPHTLEVVDVIG